MTTSQTICFQRLGLIALVGLFNGALFERAALAQSKPKPVYRSALVKRFLASDMSQTDIASIFVPVLKQKNVPQACKSSIDSFLAFDASMRASMDAQRQSNQAREDALNNARRAGLPPQALAAIAQGNEMAAQQAIASAARTQESFDNYMSYIDSSCKSVK